MVLFFNDCSMDCMARMTHWLTFYTHSRWMGPLFHDWIDYNGVAFLIELLEWGRTFSDFLG